MSYFIVGDDYFDHPKTIRLRTMIGPDAEMYPIRLWGWAYKYARSGILDDQSQIEQACRWAGEPGKLLKALVAVVFVEPDGVTIRNWMKHTGKGIQHYERRKSRQKENYHAKMELVQPDPPHANGTVETTLYHAWQKSGGYPISQDKGAQFIRAAIDRGANPQQIEINFWNSTHCRGKKIWEVLDPLCVGGKSWDQITREWVEEDKRAKG